MTDPAPAREPMDEPIDATEHWRGVAAGADQVRATFLAHVGDALESPMHGLLGNLELIDSSVLSPDDRDRFATAQAAAQLLASRIDGLMQLAASETRPYQMAHERITPIEFLDAVEGAWQRRLAVRGQLLVTDFDGATDALSADWARLRRIVDRLLDNVQRHATAGLVQVQLALVEQILTLRVTDSGPGVSDADAPAMVAPFRSLPTATGVPHDRLGIGLAVALRLAEAVGGSLSVANAAGGTEVTVTVPTERRADRNSSGAVERRGDGS
jgi:signal transduction histidine kinase